MSAKVESVYVKPRQYANIFNIPYKKVKQMLTNEQIPNASKQNGRWQIEITREQKKGQK